MGHTVLYDFLCANLAFLTNPEMRIKCAYFTDRRDAHLLMRIKNAHFKRI